MNSMHIAKALLVDSLSRRRVPVRSQRFKKMRTSLAWSRSRDQFKCPAGWNIVERNKMFGT